MAVDQQAEERHAALMAVSTTLTVGDQLTLVANARRAWPRLAGAKVADILDLTTDHDMFLDKTEPFFAAHGYELPNTPGVIFAAHVLLILGRELTVPAVLEILVRAGIVDEAPGYDPVHDLAVVLVEAYTGNYRARTAPELAGALARLRVHIDLTSTEGLEPSLRALLRKEH